MPLRKEMIAVRHRAAALVSTVLALATATLALPAPAQAVVTGLNVQIRLPKTFTADAEADTLTAVVSSQQQGQRCRKVRWSMLLQLRGVRLDQVHVDRIEGDQPFALQVQNQGDSLARLTDAQFDPGALCPGGTVTATYRVAFSGGNGTAAFQIDALDAGNRVLQRATSTSEVVSEAADPETPQATRSASPPAEENPSPNASDDTGGVTGADDQNTAAPGAGDAAVAQVPPQKQVSANGRTPSLLGPGLIIGAILMFLGIGLLLRLRARSGRLKNQRRMTPTSFYPAP